MMQKLQETPYYLGLDIGTDSVGWAMTDLDYNVLKFHSNAAWGIRLFDESKTAEERRMYRTARRRTQRRRERLDLLEMLFDREISAVDPCFFRKLKESNLYPEDKTAGEVYALFTDKDYTDKDYHRDYPTVYHLRRELIHSESPHDVRLVFLALHHIIKTRGHFLFDGVKDTVDFGEVYDSVVLYLRDNYDLDLSCPDIPALQEILKNKRISKTEKKKQLRELFKFRDRDQKQELAILYLLGGSSVKLQDIFNDEDLKDAEKNSISFAAGFEENEGAFQSVLQERFELIEMLKALYDWALLADILDGEAYLADAKVKTYEKHKEDLLRLKAYVRAYRPRESYLKIFSDKKNKENYVAYTGHSKKNHHSDGLEKRCDQETFCKFLKKELGKCADDAYTDMFDEIAEGIFLPKQVQKENSVIPMQLHKKELEAILKNAEAYLPFLKEADEKGITVSEKIKAVFSFRIPYYVGPLNEHSSKGWIVRKDEKIYPWNFKEVVDEDRSAEAFIKNLTSKCTYLPRYDVIPKNSLLYTKFMVLNELNNLTLDGESVEVSLKQDIYRDLFLKRSRVTGKGLRDYLATRGITFETIGGFDKDFKASLKPWRELAEFDLSEDDKEEIVLAITIFGDDKKLLKKRLKGRFGDRLTEDELKKLAKLKYSGWSRLSREFLIDVTAAYKPTGEVMNIITAMWETKLNLMQILYSDVFACDGDEKKTFEKKIAELNSFGKEKSLREMVEELYVSPKVKRPIYQSLLIIKELEKIMKHPPKKIFIEVARGADKVKKRTVSRKQQLLDLYEKCGDDIDRALVEDLERRSDDELRQDKLFLYYAQLGKSAYSGKTIDLDQLLYSNVYDIDHIFPRSKIKDDSIDNRVLALRKENHDKGDVYPIREEVRSQMKSFWLLLKSRGLISQKKYERLTRNYELTDDELSAFINRQLVETRQSTKAVARILEGLYEGKGTEIVYVKAALAADFRDKSKDENEEHDMLKCREVNDLHHAKDAYLNIVVGNVYHEKVTKNKLNFIKGLKINGGGYSLNKMFDYDIPGAWVKDRSLEIVKKTMAKNNIRYTRYAYKQQGKLFELTIQKKGKGQVSIKANSPRSDIQKYGGYKSASAAYFALVEYKKTKTKSIRQFVAVDVYREKEYLQDPYGYLERVVGKPVTILLPCVKCNACISVDGFRMHISNKKSGGSQLGCKPAMQLVLPIAQERYLRTIAKGFEKQKDMELIPGITKEENQKIYRSIIEKIGNTIFQVKFNDLRGKLENKQAVFDELSLNDQCKILLEILKPLHANVETANLKLIGEGPNIGEVTVTSNIMGIGGITSFKLIDQSISGLYEKEIELLDVDTETLLEEIKKFRK